MRLGVKGASLLKLLSNTTVVTIMWCVMGTLFFVIPGKALASKLSNTFYITGKVFQDLNRNGVFDGEEHGIGGVTIVSRTGERASTNVDGEFKMKIATTSELVEISCDLDTVPPHGSFSTAQSHFLNVNTGLISRISFGLFYPEEQRTFKLEPDLTQAVFFHIPSTLSHNFKLSSDGLLYQGRLLRPLDASNCTISGQQTPPIKLLIDENVAIAQNPLQLMEVNVKCDSEEFSVALPSIIIAGGKPGLNSIKPFLVNDDGPSSPYIKIPFSLSLNTTLQMDGVEVTSAQLHIPIMKGKTKHQLNILRENGTAIKFDLILGVPKIFKSLRDGSQGELTLKYAKFLDAARDTELHFQGVFTDLKKVEVGSQAILNKGEASSFLVTGKRGVNRLPIKLTRLNGKVEHRHLEFTIYPSPKIYFEIASGLANNYNVQDISTNNYNFLYMESLSGVLWLRYQQFWGLYMELNTEFSPVPLEYTSIATGDTGEVSGRHLDGRLSATRTFYLDNDSFYSTTLTVLAGLQQLTFYQPTDSDKVMTLYLPEKTLLATIGAKWYFPYVAKSSISLESSIMLGSAISDFSVYSWEVGEKMIVDLNFIGKYWGETPSFGHNYRYPWWKNLKGTVKLNIKGDQQPILSRSGDYVSSYTIGINLGVAFQY
ncbi:MAG: hypothetical protein HN353_09690 [Bdellovibrionales bacterium]|nr:hypothetical protein [Bdellovibrionales bacterium]MBT3527170.1 hypothetical protein [Bdellovibrionales bacterium]MBT7668150.1 hypothetical protein [Bdellovibrionales bacterium]